MSKTIPLASTMTFFSPLIWIKGSYCYQDFERFASKKNAQNFNALTDPISYILLQEPEAIRF